jgi:hypothetical protein
MAAMAARKPGADQSACAWFIAKTSLHLSLSKYPSHSPGFAENRTRVAKNCKSLRIGSHEKQNGDGLCQFEKCV